MKHWILLFTLLTTSFSVWATHNRAGEIVYRHKGGASPTYEITVITYTESASLADRDSLTVSIEFVGGTSIFQDSVHRDQVFSFLPDEGIQQNFYTLESFTFPGPGTYVISMRDPNRIEGICNMTGSVNVPFYIEDTLIIRDPQFYAYNSSPVLLASPIIYAEQYQVFNYNPGAYDPDGDSLTFSLIPPKSDPITDVPNYFYPGGRKDPVPGFPTNLFLDSSNGDLQWEVPHVCCVYNIAYLIREYREGVLMGTQIRDMQIIVQCSQTKPPRISIPNDTCVVAGDRLTAGIQGQDPDPGDFLTLSASGGPFFVDDSPAQFLSTPTFSPVNGFFDWRTNCTHISPRDYTVVFKVEDDYQTAGGKDQPLSDIGSWNIRVVAPPPENLVANVLPNAVELSWQEPYACAEADTFLGFTVWRKRGCDSLALDACFTSSLSTLGYTKIAGPIKDYSYTDETVSKGVVYAYRIVPEFARKIPGSSIFTFNDVSGIPSEEVCAVVNADVPLLTQVDVTITDVVAGQIAVAWVAPDPDVLDTVLNAPPYTLELYRHSGFVPGPNPTLLQTFTYPTFQAMLADNYVDNGLNTVDGPYTYTLVLYNEDSNGQPIEIGTATAASSIYLTTIAGGNEIALLWETEVPWVNYEYLVLREQSGNPGVYDTITRTPATSFTDVGLINGVEYCYLIRGVGSYFNPITPAPLINRSQVRCDVPQDTVPPCVPTLTITNPCEEIAAGGLVLDNLYNLLTWSNPIDDCGEEDLVGYNIYYSATSDEPLTLLAAIADPYDNRFLHDDLPSLAGCYAVTAIDSFGNESSTSNKLCIDNCPYYVLPSAFSPNGDGDNDVYTPFLPYYFVDRVEMTIFNRWGNQVFYTEDPMINWTGVDGVSGEPLAEGAYFYTCKVFEVRVDGVVQLATPLSGYIQLMRGQN